MAIGDNSINLRNQILSNSGLSGRDLEALKTRLAALSEEQLQAELAKTLSGDKGIEWGLGVSLEHSESVVMLDNYDKNTFTDENGNEITEYKDGDTLTERIIKSKDKDGNIIETTVTYQGGRPLTQAKSINGNTAETNTFNYNEDADVPYVTVQTKKSDQSEVITNVLEVDENGNYEPEDFIDRQTTTLDGTTKYIFIEKDNIVEQQTQPNGKKTDTVYKGSDLADYDDKKLNRLYQRIEKDGKVYEAAYDGNGNTYTTANAGDVLAKIAKRYNVSATRTEILNKKIRNLQAGQRVLVAGEHDADSRGALRTQSPQKARQIANRAEYNRQIAQKVTEGTDSRMAAELSQSGFKPIPENYVFYRKFNALNPSQQQNVLSLIKYCKTQNITEPDKIKAKILDTFPEINLFDSGKIIPQANWMTHGFQRSNPISLETFLTESLKLDLKTEPGKTVYDRLVNIPQEELNTINIQNFGDMSGINLYEILSKFITAGFDIRTEAEIQIAQAHQAHREEELGIPQQKFTSEILASIYDNAADRLEQYYHNHGILDAGTYIEGMKNIFDAVLPDNVLGADLRGTLHIADDCRAAARRFRQMHTNDPYTFKKEYKQLKKDGLVTTDYNEQNIKEFMALIQSGDADINSDKFKQACQKAFGFKGVENTEKYIQTGQMAGNIGDIAVMLYTLGAASELKAMGKATQGVYGALEKGAGKFMGKAAAQKTAKVGTSMATGGGTLAGFTAIKETGNNLTNQTRDFTSWETWKETLTASAESFGFGVAGGVVTEVAVAPIVKAIEKPATKQVQAITKALSEQGELNGSQIMKAVTDSGSLKLDGLFKMNSQELASLARTVTAKGVGFGVEVAGFTAYETALDVVKDIIDPKTGRLPDDMTVENLADYLGGKLGEQVENLGTIKGISQLVMMTKGGKVAQQAMMNKLLTQSESLKNLKFQKTEINGHEAYIVTKPDGNREMVRSPEQIISLCNITAQMEMISNIQKEEISKILTSEIQGQKEEPAWHKVKIGEEELEFPITTNPDGTKNIDFSHARKLKPNGEYEEFEVTTKDDLMSSYYETQESPQRSGISDAEFASRGRELCTRPDGVESPAAKALLEAVRNSELNSTAIDPQSAKLGNFKTMSRGYGNKMFSEEMLGYAKEMIESIPKGKDRYLIDGTEYSIQAIIESNLEYATPEAKRQIVDATKKLLSHPNVRNSAIEDIINACVEGSQKVGYTFNQKAFDNIYKMFEKKVKNRETTGDYAYGLMVAEIAKNAIRYEKDTKGNQVRIFDDIGYKIGLQMPASDPRSSYVHYELRRNDITNEININEINTMTQNYIKNNFDKKFTELESKAEWWVKEQGIKEIRELCTIDGELNAQNCFAVDYMAEKLDLSYSKIKKYLSDCRNENGVFDMSMLRTLKDNKTYVDKYGKGLYNSEGIVTPEIISQLDNAPNTTNLTKHNGRFANYDISQHYIVDGKIDIDKLQNTEKELNQLRERLAELDIDISGTWRSETLDHDLATLYNEMKENPAKVDEIFDLLSKIENFKYDYASYRTSRGYAIYQCAQKSGKGFDIEQLRFYASLPADVYKIVARNPWIEPIIRGEGNRQQIETLKQEDKDILRNYGIDIDYLKESETNKTNKTSEVSPQAQTQFEQTIESLDQTLATADVSRGIELEYTREHFEKDILDAVKDLPEVKANDVLNSYGLTMRDGKIEGVICEPKVKAPTTLAEVDQKIKQAIDKFQNNKITTQDPELNSLYTAITTDFPEFTMLVGKVGKDGQRVDTTVLKQIQTLVNNPQYKTLSPKEQQMAKLVLMFRGFSEIDSTPNVISKTFQTDNDGLSFDVTHRRYKNSEYTAEILKRFNLTDSEKYALGDLVAHSGWSREFNGGMVDKDILGERDIKLHNENSNAARVAVNTRFGTLKLSKLIEDVINPGNNVDMSAIEAAQKQVYQNMQVVNTVTAEDLEPYWETQIIDGVECQVIDLRKTKLPDDFYLMGHFSEYGAENLFNLLSNPNDKVFFSNSLIRPGAAQTFAGRKEGIISEFDNRNVAEAYEYNIDSGFGKSYNSFVETMSGSGTRQIKREVCKQLNLTHEEYGLLMEQIADKRLKDIDEYYNIGNKVLRKQDIINAHNSVYEEFLRDQGEQNEITILNQKPIAYVYSADRSSLFCPFNMSKALIKRVIIFP